MRENKLFEKECPPTLILRAGLDESVDNGKIQEYFETIPQKDKQMLTYDDVDHQLLQDGEYISLIVHDVVSWMNQRAHQI